MTGKQEAEMDHPKTTPWSDIDLNRWRDYHDVLTDSLWFFPSRARGDGHQLDYHGNFVPQIATQTFTQQLPAPQHQTDIVF